jgi:hypothetical protein
MSLVKRGGVGPVDFAQDSLLVLIRGTGPLAAANGMHELGGGVMDTVVRYQVGDDSSVLVEVDEDTYGVEEVSRASDGVTEAGQRLESALGSVRDAAQATLDTLTKLSPETVEVEFGIKLAGEAGALIAKTSAEGHFTVRLSWSPGSNEKP